MTETRTRTCDPATATTRSLLGWGAVAGPLYVAVALAQALTRDGFDLSRHSWSLLANGSLGWIQIADFLLAGAMTVAFAIGVRRATGSVWAPRLLAGYGLALVAAGVFRADPAAGFPVGTPADAATISWHGGLHLLAGALGFGCLIAACLVLGRRYAHAGRSGRALFSRVTGTVFLVAFLGIASGSGSPATVLPFAAAVVLAWGWLTGVAVDLYRRA
jgi:hypothetical membrane protein